MGCFGDGSPARHEPGGRGLKGDRPTVVTISLGAIRSNYRLACRMAAGSDVIAVVKADAYGHGARAVGPALAEAGCGRFAVVTVGIILAFSTSPFPLLPLPFDCVSEIITQFLYFFF